MSCDVGNATEELENELWRRWSDRKVGEWALLCVFELCSFSNLSVTSPTSHLILQPFRRFTYITAHSPTVLLIHLRHSSLSSPSFASPTSQALHLIHLASRSCLTMKIFEYLTTCMYLHWLQGHMTVSQCKSGAMLLIYSRFGELINLPAKIFEWIMGWGRICWFLEGHARYRKDRKYLHCAGTMK